YSTDTSTPHLFPLSLHDALPICNLGVALHAQNRLDEAVAACRKAIDLQPDFAGAYSNLGGVLYAQNRPDEAVAAYREAIALQPRSEEHTSELQSQSNLVCRLLLE